ncbi:YppG family protein [Bacillus gobiensis]|uniref:YppG family protein n=1 Tax=Bacillus gobiensis TaxID=1441095 RepID=UPI003D20388B
MNNRRQTRLYPEQLYGYAPYHSSAQQYPHYPSAYQTHSPGAAHNQYPTQPQTLSHIPYYDEQNSYQGMQQLPLSYPNPYPQPRPNQQQPSQFMSIMSQFKKSNGQYDFNKLMDTAGQMMNTVNQMGSLAKGFTSFFKS